MQPTPHQPLPARRASYENSETEGMHCRKKKCLHLNLMFVIHVNILNVLSHAFCAYEDIDGVEGEIAVDGALTTKEENL